MESRIQAVLERLEARSQQENSLLESLRSQGGSAIRERAENLMLDVGPEVGLFLNLLVRSTRATAVIEIGGSVGYSTIWLAEAVRANGGRLYSFEVNSAKQQEQKENLEAAGLLSVVELIDREAIEVIPEIATDIDLVLLDHWKELYVRDFEVCWPKLKTGGCIVADNILRPQKNAAVISAYLDRVRACTDARSTLLPIGDGIEMTVKI